MSEAPGYTYIGKDGKPILARDLEDQRDAAREHAQELVSFVRTVAHGRHNMATAMTQARRLLAKTEQENTNE